MSQQDLILNIAVNLARIGRFILEKKDGRVALFMDDTKNYLNLLNSQPVSDSFKKTLSNFSKKYYNWQKSPQFNDARAEEFYTWAQILTHRSKLA